MAPHGRSRWEQAVHGFWHFLFTYFWLIKTGGSCWWFRSCFSGKKFGELLSLSLTVLPPLPGNKVCFVFAPPHVSALMSAVSRQQRRGERMRAYHPTPLYHRSTSVCCVDCSCLGCLSPFGVFGESDQRGSEDPHWPLRVLVCLQHSAVRITIGVQILPRFCSRSWW